MRVIVTVMSVFRWTQPRFLDTGTACHRPVSQITKVKMTRDELTSLIRDTSIDPP